MIHFITKGKHEVNEVEEELRISNTVTPQEIDQIRAMDILGLDLETNDLDPFIGSILLLIIGDKENQYVIDCTTVDCEQLLLSIINITPTDSLSFKDYRRLKKVVIGANIKFDFKFVKVKWDIELMKMFDVMIAEQILNQGKDELDLKTGRRIPMSAALANIVKRRLGFLPSAMDKTIRDEFIGVNPSTFKFKNKHIYYAAGDIQHLFDIRVKQKEEIARYNLNFLVYHIEFPLIRVLGNAELVGEDIHEDLWRENIRRNKELKFEAEVFLDNEIRRLRDILLPVNEKIWLSNGKYDRPRVKHADTVQDNLFGDAFEEIEINPIGKEKKPTKIDNPYINYSSTDQVVYILGRLKQSVPTHISKSKQIGNNWIPTFKTDRHGKIVIDKSVILPYSFTTNADALEVYKAENRDSVIKDLITRLIAFRTYVTRLSTFGEEFLRKYKNRITKRFHTIYRQCHAITGRLQSGDEDNGWYNSQNLPKEKEYRVPFHDDNNHYITTDLSGAEAVIMIDKARDEKFYEIHFVNDDSHGYLATAVWRAIGDYRRRSLSDSFYNGELEEWDYQSSTNAADELSNIVISKSQNKDKRTDFKPHTFGDIYGMGDKKRSKVLGVSIEESRIAGSTQKSLIPKTYAMVNRNARFAITNGYVVLNFRTNRRMWYSEVLEVINSGKNIWDREFSNIRHNAESSAKNSPIQGTQADMIKETMVEIDKEADRQNLDVDYCFRLLKQVHDETAYSATKKIDIKAILVEFIRDDGIVEMVTIPDFVSRWHTQVCNRYLSFIKMNAEQHVDKSWMK